jgi:hypothetical protein
LPNKVQAGGHWRPALPLILGAWHYSSNLEKMARLQDHIAWASEQGKLGQVSAFLQALPESDWHHLND